MNDLYLFHIYFIFISIFIKIEIEKMEKEDASS